MKPQSGSGPPRGFFAFDDSKPYALTNGNGQLEFYVPATGPDRPEWLSKELLPSDSEDGADNVSLSKLVDESGSEASTSLDRNLHASESPSLPQVDDTTKKPYALGTHNVMGGAATFQLGDYLVDDTDLDGLEGGYLSDAGVDGLSGDAMDAFISFGDDSSE